MIEIYMDSFKYSYKGYWSNIKTALKELPKCADFKRCIDWNTEKWHQQDGFNFEPDWDFNKRIIPVLEYVEEDERIKVFLDGYRYKKTKTITTEEIKEVGKPYKPSETAYEDHGIKTIDRPVCYASVYKLFVDRVLSEGDL